MGETEIPLKKSILDFVKQLKNASKINAYNTTMLDNI